MDVGNGTCGAGLCLGQREGDTDGRKDLTCLQASVTRSLKASRGIPRRAACAVVKTPPSERARSSIAAMLLLFPMLQL